MGIFFLIVSFAAILISSFSFASSMEVASVACLLSLFFFIYLFVSRKIKKIPTYSLIAVLIVSLTFFLSILINSVDQPRSYESLFLWTSYILFFVASTQIPLTEKKINWSIFLFVAACVLLFAFKLVFPTLLPFITASDRQFILPSSGMHNHLGDIVGLGLVSVLLIVSSPYLASIARLLFIPIIILSFTKSALLSLFVILIFAGIAIKEKRENFLYTAFVLFYIGVAAIVVFSLEFSTLSFVAPIQKYIQSSFNISPKPLLSQRDAYTYQTALFLFRSPIEYVGFGVGLGNFSYASSKTTDFGGKIIADPHNIFLTFLVEGGIVSLLWTALFLSSVSYYGVKYKRNTLFLFLYLLFLFQTDYVFQIPAFLFLFFFLAGQTVRVPCEEKNTSNVSDLWLWIFLFILVGFTSFQSYSVKAQYVREQTNLTKALKTNSISGIDKSADILLSLTPYDDTLLIRLSSIYEAYKQEDRAISLLEKLLVFSPHSFIENLPHLLQLKEAAKQDILAYIRSITPELRQATISYEERTVLKSLCVKYASVVSCFK